VNYQNHPQLYHDALSLYTDFWYSTAPTVKMWCSIYAFFYKVNLNSLMWNITIYSDDYDKSVYPVFQTWCLMSNFSRKKFSAVEASRATSVCVFRKKLLLIVHIKGNKYVKRVWLLVFVLALAKHLVLDCITSSDNEYHSCAEFVHCQWLLCICCWHQG